MAAAKKKKTTVKNTAPKKKQPPKILVLNDSVARYRVGTQKEISTGDGWVLTFQPKNSYDSRTDTHFDNEYVFIVAPCGDETILDIEETRAIHTALGEILKKHG